MNHFFKIVVPQTLQYFEENAKDIPNLLIPDVLKTEDHQEEIKEVQTKADEISEKHKKDNKKQNDI